MSSTIPGTCPHCGVIDAAACPWVKAIEYHENGTVKRVEYHDPRPAPVYGIHPWNLGLPGDVTCVSGTADWSGPPNSVTANH